MTVASMIHGGRRARFVHAAILVVAFGSGCGTCDESYPKLVITSPTDGQTLTSADDVDATAAGVQIDVAVSARGLAEGEVVRVFTDGSVLDDPDATTPYAAVVGAAETVLVRATLADGTNRLVACARERCAVQSEVVEVTLNGSGCPGVTFLSPAPGTGDSLTLGPPDDVDGTACGTTFQTRVEVAVQAATGTETQLLVNGAVAATGMVDPNGRVDFGAVTLGNRGATANTLAVRITGASEACSGAFGKPIFVDCDGPSCSITQPMGSAYLNASDDSDPVVSGLQVTIEATSDADAAGHPVTLTIDGDTAGARTVDAAATGPTATATFPLVPLAEGARSVQAACTDGAGNTTLSSVVMWTVDTVPCTPSFVVPVDNAAITVADDANPATSDVDLATSGSLSADDCADARVALCSAIASAPFVATTGSSFASTVTLSNEPSQTLCVEARDEAGNVGTDEVSVVVDASTGVQLVIVSPAPNASFNVAGNAGRTADLAPATAACDVRVEIACEAVGVPVSLEVDGNASGAPTTTCAADSASLLGGRAVFASVALPTATTAHTLIARQTVGGAVRSSAPIAITGDCAAPALAIVSPTCGSTLGASDDQGTDPGIQRDVVVALTETPQLAVSLRIAPQGGNGAYTATSPAAAANAMGEHLFTDADFDSNGVKTVSATATDAFGNVGTTAACTVTVSTSLPSVTITTPLDGTSINAQNLASFDCDAGTPAVLDLQVTATTNATNGSAATVQVGTAAPVPTTVSAGAISACVPVTQQGTLLVRAGVNDTDASDGASGESSATPVTIRVQTTAPGAIAPIQVVYGDHDSKRRGEATLTFTTVQDSQGSALASYELRCSIAPIDSAGTWSAATVIPNAVVPVPVGSDSVPIRFRPSLYRYCLVRGVDSAGNLSALPASDASVLVNPTFDSVRVTSATGNYLGYGDAAAPAGDVNGDGFGDLIVSGYGGAALYFGGPTITATAPSVVFEGPVTSSFFGTFAAGIGDYNGDGRSDFAIGDPSSNGFDGAVYVFFGRSAGVAWPGTITLTDTSCDADLCFRAAAGSLAGLGQGLVGIGNFDGAGSVDLAIGASGINEVLVVSGSATVPATTRTWVFGSASEPDGFRITGTPSVPNGYDFGYDILPFGDPDGDGFQDLGIFQPGLDTSYNPSPTRRSQIFRIEGRTRSAAGMNPLTMSDLQVALSDATWNNARCLFGLHGEIATADFDDDGYVDLACGTTDPSANRANIVYGNASGTFDPAVTTLIQCSVAPSLDSYAFSSAHAMDPVHGSVGDIDRDGIQDFLVGSAETGPYTSMAAANVVYGRAGRPAQIDPLNDLDFGITVPSPVPSIQYPLRRVAYVGDLNGDGWADIVVGDPVATTGDTNGQFFILY